MRISLYKILLLTFVAFPVFAQDYHPQVLVNKYYYQCASRMGPTKNDDNPGFKSSTGSIGLFQFTVMNAYQAGLCNNPVPIMHTEQVWKFCDFKGPIAEKYNIHSLYDFRYDSNAKAAQFEMMHNLTPIYDDLIYQKRYDLSFGKPINGVMINPDVLRGLLHSKGYAAVDELMHNIKPIDSQGRSLYALGTCLNQCMTSKGKQWYCD